MQFALLPRLPQEALMVPLKIKRRLGHEASYSSAYIRPEKVNIALRYLMLHNPMYKDCQSLEYWQSDWENTEPALWSALIQENDTPVPSSFCDFETLPNDMTMTPLFTSPLEIADNGTPVPSSFRDFEDTKNMPKCMNNMPESPLPSSFPNKRSIHDFESSLSYKKLKTEHIHHSDSPPTISPDIYNTPVVTSSHFLKMESPVIDSIHLTPLRDGSLSTTVSHIPKKEPFSDIPHTPIISPHLGGGSLLEDSFHMSCKRPSVLSSSISDCDSIPNLFSGEGYNMIHMPKKS